jgi:hypothetical protein
MLPPPRDAHGLDVGLPQSRAQGGAPKFGEQVLPARVPEHPASIFLPAAERFR